MRISRDFTSKIHYMLDHWIPPFIRDSKWFMDIPFKLLYKDKADIFLTFKDKAQYMDAAAFSQVYKKVGSVLVERETDLNEKCLKAILRNIKGSTVLDAGCGNALLAKTMSKKYHVTAADIFIKQKLIERYPTIKFNTANIENLPFKQQSFDTVVCAHTLEHVQHFSKALSELRRVARKRLIIVVPKQRPYRYTFDLHLLFFPYKHSLLGSMGKQKSQKCTELDGDWFYVENK